MGLDDSHGIMQIQKGYGVIRMITQDAFEFLLQLLDALVLLSCLCTTVICSCEGSRKFCLTPRDKLPCAGYSHTQDAPSAAC